MRVASLGSGSRGNATLLATAETHILIDDGFSLRDLEKRAAGLAFDLACLDAILVTHEHSDHCSGVAALARRYQIPVYMTHGTAASGRLDGCTEVRLFDADSSLAIGSLTVHAVAVPHDAREPVQYVVEADEGRIGVLTDLGSVTPHVCAAFANCDLLVLEFNHDRQMLAEGPYPAALKRRVGGDWGHLSNTQAVEFLRRTGSGHLQHLVIAHTSEKNNARHCVAELLEQEFPDLVPGIVWADQEKGFPWLSVSQRGAHVDVDADGESNKLASGVAVGAY